MIRSVDIDGKDTQLFSAYGSDNLSGTSDLKQGIWPKSMPLWSAMVYMALFLIRPWDEMVPWLGTIHFERSYFILMLLIILFSSKRQRLESSSQNFSVLTFLCAIGLSCVLGINFSASWEQLYIYLTLVAFYFVLLLVIRNTYELVFIITSYIAIMTLYLAKAQWEFFVHGHHVYRMGVVRLIGLEYSYGSPNSLSMSIVASLPLLLFIWNVRNDFSRTWPEKYKRLFPCCLIAYFFLAVTSIILTNSRGGALGFVFFVFLVTFCRGKGVEKKIGSLFVAVLVLWALWAGMSEEHQNRLRTIWNPEAGPANAETSVHGRIEGLYAGLAMFEKYPFTGVGVGNFIQYRVAHLDGVRLNAHNLIGQILGETGLMGFCSFFLVILSTLLNIRKVKYLSENCSELTLIVLSKLPVACRDSLLLLFFIGIFNHNLKRYNWLWIAAFVLLALKFTIEYLNEQDLEREIHSQ